MSHQLPHVGNGGRGGHRAQLGDIQDYLQTLAARLRRVRVTCGDWQRVLGPSVTTGIGLTGVFLDPPYTEEAGRDKELYAVEDLSVAHRVREWAIANGDSPKMRIALCGYEGEHAMPDNWTVLEWKARGGYGSQNKAGNDNPHKERIWFSPHCLSVERAKQAVMDFAA